MGKPSGEITSSLRQRSRSRSFVSASLRRTAISRFASFGLNAASAFSRLGRNTFKVKTAHRELTVVSYPADLPLARRRQVIGHRFATLAWGRGLRQLPEPLACDVKSRLSLRTYVEGQPLAPTDLNLQRVSEALGFLLAVNRFRPFIAGTDMPRAVDARFSLEGHFDRLGRQVAALETTARRLGDHRAANFARDQLEPAWQIIQQRLAREIQRLGLDPSARLKLSECCLSPGDFGLHRALMTPSGNLCFFDFAEAGWDDPAMVTARFFHREPLPAPPEFFAPFARHLARSLGQGVELLRRTRLLRPVVCLDECCRVYGRRSASSAGGTAPGRGRAWIEFTRAQIEKARKLLEREMSED